MNKRLLTVAAFALAGCVTVVAQDKKKEFKMPTGYAGITHEMSEFYEPVPPDFSGFVSNRGRAISIVL